MANSLMTLNDIIDRGNWSLIRPGLQAQQTEQQTAEQSLADLMQANQHRSQMLPWEIEAKKAAANLNNASAAESGQRVIRSQDEMAGMLPPQERQAQARGKYGMEVDQNQRQQEEHQLKMLGDAIMRMQANGGKPTLDMVSSNNPLIKAAIANPQAAVAYLQKKITEFNPEYQREQLQQSGLDRRQSAQIKSNEKIAGMQVGARNQQTTKEDELHKQIAKGNPIAMEQMALRLEQQAAEAPPEVAQQLEQQAQLLRQMAQRAMDYEIAKRAQAALVGQEGKTGLLQGLGGDTFEGVSAPSRPVAPAPLYPGKSKPGAGPSALPPVGGAQANKPGAKPAPQKKVMTEEEFIKFYLEQKQKQGK